MRMISGASRCKGWQGGTDCLVRREAHHAGHAGLFEGRDAESHGFGDTVGAALAQGGYGLGRAALCRTWRGDSGLKQSAAEVVVSKGGGALLRAAEERLEGFTGGTTEK